MNRDNACETCGKLTSDTGVIVHVTNKSGTLDVWECPECLNKREFKKPMEDIENG